MKRRIGTNLPDSSAARFRTRSRTVPRRRANRGRWPCRTDGRPRCRESPRTRTPGSPDRGRRCSGDTRRNPPTQIPPPGVIAHNSLGSPSSTTAVAILVACAAHLDPSRIALVVGVVAVLRSWRTVAVEVRAARHAESLHAYVRAFAGPVAPTRRIGTALAVDAGLKERRTRNVLDTGPQGGTSASSTSSVRGIGCASLVSGTTTSSATSDSVWRRHVAVEFGVRVLLERPGPHRWKRRHRRRHRRRPPRGRLLRASVACPHHRPRHPRRRRPPCLR